MSLASIAQTMLERFGDRVEVYENQKLKETFAVIQPLLYKNKMYLSGTLTDAGYFDGSHYLMIAPANIKVEDWKNTKIVHAGNSYKVKKVEVISSLGLDLYIWVVLVPLCGELEDDYEEA